jgi:hypothetical protein
VFILRVRGVVSANIICYDVSFVFFISLVFIDYFTM